MPLDNRSEGEIQKEVVRRVRAMGFEVWITSQRKRTEVSRGVPDLIIIGRGHVVFFEMKTRLGTSKPEQIQFGKAVLASGGNYHIVRHEDVAVAYLQELIG